MKQILPSLFILCFVMAWTGCYYDNEEDLYPPTVIPIDTTTPVTCDTAGPVTYTVQVKKVLDTKYAVSSCHDAGTMQGFTNLSVYSTSKNAATRIEVRALQQKTMPPAGSPALTACEMAILQKWINTGTAQ